MNILWLRPSGTLAVTSIFDGSDPAEHAALLQKRGDVPADWAVAATNVTVFPEAWPRQEDWRFVGGQAAVDLGCAKETTRARIRQEREPLFAANDLLLLRDALLEGDAAKKAEGLAERDRLRALPELADAAETLEELKLLKGA